MAPSQIVVDANIVVSALLKDSFTRRILLSEKAPALFVPEFMQQELFKYSGEFAKRLRAEKNDLEETLSRLLEESKTKILPRIEYSEFLQKALTISPDPKDAPYFAIALKLHCPIWSNDSALKKQSTVKVFSTAELAKQLK